MGDGDRHAEFRAGNHFHPGYGLFDKDTQQSCQQVGRAAHGNVGDFLEIVVQANRGVCCREVSDGLLLVFRQIFSAQKAVVPK